MKLRLLYLFFISLLISCTSDQQALIDLPDEGYKTINGSEVYFKTMGQGEPMIVIHGGPVLDHSYFLPQFEELAKDYQLIFYDQRVCGRSSIDVDSTTMSLAGFVEDIELLRQGLELDNIHLLGHSWGGLLAMKYAIEYPQHLNSLILSNSMPASEGQWQEEEQELAQRMTTQDSISRAEIIGSQEMKENPSAAIQKLMLLSFKPQFHNPELLDQLSLSIPKDFQERGKAFQPLGKDLASFDLYPALSKLEIPTLVIYGDYEPAAKLSGKRLSEIIPKSQFLVIENCGHFPFVEQPNAFFNGIKNFIENKESI